MSRVTLAELRRLAQEAPQVASQAVAASLPSIRAAAVSGLRRHFQREESPDGRAWAPMKFPRPDGGGKLLRDKGTLLASTQGRITGTGVELLASHPAANVHQFGAVIKPTRGKFLSIPLTKEAKRAGSPRRFPRRMFVLAIGGGKNLYLVEPTADGLVFQYVLRESVTVPARPYMGFSAETMRTIERIIGDRAERILMRLFARDVRVDPPPDNPFT